MHLKAKIKVKHKINVIVNYNVIKNNLNGIYITLINNKF